MDKQIELLATDVSNVIKDYKNTELDILDEDHVLRWLSQFEDRDKNLVIEETFKILQRNYLSKTRFDKYIRGLVSSTSFTRNDSGLFWNKVSLLNIQKKTATS